MRITGTELKNPNLVMAFQTLMNTATDAKTAYRVNKLIKALEKAKEDDKVAIILGFQHELYIDYKYDSLELRMKDLHRSL